jgi:hypothetical protein
MKKNLSLLLRRKNKSKSKMGNSYSSTNTVPQNVPIVVVDPKFAMQQTITLKLKNKIFSFSGEDSTVKDSNGNPFL